ncbi:molybdate ABC transporter substrate-binding protein [uncultured Sulfitobacter sp.]|uniref:molybdate ABC transporter substrate-binding protein n=1 Tax=uncultured Sulfitobacter sp. TaxID=191468 RepID=UPI00262A1A76|nr:molybdate ABC transporter substrate-binding protein [uncultured Sulfitobacter sp.]
MPPLAGLRPLADSLRHMRRVFFLLFASLWFALPALAQPVTVFAAASLRDALSDIAQSYPDKVTLSFAGSGTVARQVAAGAPADVVVLAHRDWALWMQAQDLVLPDSLRDVAGGRLVVVGAADAPDIAQANTASLTAALNGGRIAMGQRDGVPAGTYAREWLTSIGAWQALAPQLAETDNVRAALALVAAGAAPLGVVYASDAVAEPRVRIVYEIPAATHSPIRYPAAAATAAGRAFVAHLTTPQAAQTFAKHGFAP